MTSPKPVIPNSPGIYQIRNIKNNKVYIGSAVNLKQRRRNHFSDLKRNKHHSQRLQNSYNKHGSKFFVFEIIKLVKKESDLIKEEQTKLDEIKPYNDLIGYNILKIAGNSLGLKHSKKTKEKMSRKRKGKIPWNKGLKGFGMGRKMSAATKKKISEANKGKQRTKKAKEKMSLIKKGKKKLPHSQKTKQKIGKANRGENCGSAILNEQQVIEIRKKYVPKLYTQKMLAEEYKTSASTIQAIIERRSWKHI